MRDLFPVVVHTLVLRRDSGVAVAPRADGLPRWLVCAARRTSAARRRRVGVCDPGVPRRNRAGNRTATRLRPAAAMPYRSGDQQGIDFIFCCDDCGR